MVDNVRHEIGGRIDYDELLEEECDNSESAIVYMLSFSSHCWSDEGFIKFIKWCIKYNDIHALEIIKSNFSIEYYDEELDKIVSSILSTQTK